MNNNDFSAFENSIAANCLLLLEIALGATKCAKLRRGGFRPTESACDSYKFFGGSLWPKLFEHGAAKKNRKLTPSPS